MFRKIIKCLIIFSCIVFAILGGSSVAKNNGIISSSSENNEAVYFWVFRDGDEKEKRKREWQNVTYQNEIRFRQFQTPYHEFTDDTDESGSNSE